MCKLVLMTINQRYMMPYIPYLGLCFEIILVLSFILHWISVFGFFEKPSQPMLSLLICTNWLDSNVSSCYQSKTSDVCVDCWLKLSFAPIWDGKSILFSGTTKEHENFSIRFQIINAFIVGTPDQGAEDIPMIHVIFFPQLLDNFYWMRLSMI